MAAPAASPYYASPPVPHLPAVLVKPETVAGIRTYVIALILDLVFSSLALVISLTALLVTTTDTMTTLAIGAILGAAVCGLLIVFVINFIVSLMSMFKMHHGADEYGREHGHNARLGVMFKWIGTGLSTVAAVLVAYLVIFGSAVILAPSGQIPRTIYVPLLVTVFWTGGVSSKAQMYRHMVRSLQPPEMKRWADIASFLIPILGVIAIVVVGIATARVIAALENPSSVTPLEVARWSQALIGGVFLPPGLSLVGYVVFLLVYLRTSEQLSRGVAAVRAVVPPPQAWFGYQAVPPYVPAPWQGPLAPPNVPASPTVPAPAPSSVVKPCPRCGGMSRGDAVFCMHCGTRLTP